MLEKELGLEDFELEVPKAVGKIEAEEIKNKSGVKDAEGHTKTFSKIEEQVISNLDSQVENILKDLSQAKTNSKEMKEITVALSKMGDSEIDKSSNLTNRMLQRPLRALRQNDVGDGKSIASSIKKLRGKVTQLDPKAKGKLLSENKLFGIKIPFKVGSKLNSYMQEFKSSESQLNDIVNALLSGKDELIEDNAVIDVERETLHELMQRLEQYAYIIKQLDSKVEALIAETESSDKMKSTDLKQEVLFPIRQKQMDIYQHLAVCMQGYMSLQVVKRNNQELIRGVDRATKTTVSALKTAIMVSEALGTQKLVLDQIQSVNEATNQLIETNSQMLESQGITIQKAATESSINVEVLEKSFQQIFKAMDAIDSFREAALPNMKKTVESLEESVTSAKRYLSKNRIENGTN